MLQSPSPAAATAAAASLAAASASSCISRALSTASLSISMAPGFAAAGSGRDGAAASSAAAAAGSSSLAFFGPDPAAPSHPASRLAVAASSGCGDKSQVELGSGMPFSARGTIKKCTRLRLRGRLVPREQARQGRRGVLLLDLGRRRPARALRGRGTRGRHHYLFYCICLFPVEKLLCLLLRGFSMGLERTSLVKKSNKGRARNIPKSEDGPRRLGGGSKGVMSAPGEFDTGATGPSDLPIESRRCRAGTRRGRLTLWFPMTPR